MGLELEKERSRGLNLIAIGRGTLMGAVASLTGTLLMAALFYFTSLSERTFPYIVSFVLFLSGMLGGSLAARSAGNRGLIHGLAAGTALFLLLWLAAVAVLPGPVTSGMLLKKFFLLASGGALGGFLGIALLP
ncbi:putative membrane protein (TIGR04086 family) [Thermodesulfitimonas autotrophica]|uniref:Putative membrane protein (TIGR04086 family) n=1 Tax=Thermodesulfitimonas autotrophica TaxID=1894989 RepID=A0A3N5BV04_9THEO|nr:TIGR04086 family membrane protein [Thermodesulfitimonas autotrophica]RPF49725.1 putative membrane protein (TIGR04086 family) [Thermodesulfitimonas autotrophica]